MNTIEFYNVKKKIKVKILISNVQKVTYEKVSKAGKKIIRYGFKAQDEDGTNLAKFCSKADFDSVN
jgi:hypothetical protein